MGRSFSSCRRLRRQTRAGMAILAATAVLTSTGAEPAHAQVVDLDLRNTVFYEPSGESDMTVLNPRIGLAVQPTEGFSVSAAYEADIVSGATEPTKAGPLSPDIISQASISDHRHVATGGIQIERKYARLGASYSYGTENDYRSQAITVVGATDFLQRNTTLQLSYTRGFDEVCNVAYAKSLAPTLRPRLDSSEGCFTNDPSRQTQDIDLDTFQLGWTQAWTPVFTTQLIFTYGLQNGFLGNPYREVVIGSTGETAQENHPENRQRYAGGLRAKYYVRALETAFGAGFRAYDDTWDVFSTTYELEAERQMTSWLRVLVRGRYYDQSGALFWSDDYTGGEPRYGPRGQYWSGDRELSPLTSFALGGRALGRWTGTADDRIIGALLELEASVGLEWIETNLEDFSWAGEDPTDTSAFILSMSVGGEF